MAEEGGIGQAPEEGGGGECGSGQSSPWSPWMALGRSRMDRGQLSGDADIFVIFAVCFCVKLRLVVTAKTAPSL